MIGKKIISTKVSTYGKSDSRAMARFKAQIEAYRKEGYKPDGPVVRDGDGGYTQKFYKYEDRR